MDIDKRWERCDVGPRSDEPCQHSKPPPPSPPPALSPPRSPPPAHSCAELGTISAAVDDGAETFSFEVFVHGWDSDKWITLDFGAHPIEIPVADTCQNVEIVSSVSPGPSNSITVRPKQFWWDCCSSFVCVLRGPLPRKSDIEITCETKAPAPPPAAHGEISKASAPEMAETEGSSCSEAATGDTLVLDCGEKFITEVLFASYGTPSGTCEWEAGVGIQKEEFVLAQDDECHAPRSKEVIEDYCVGQTTCMIPCDPLIFGSPVPCNGVEGNAGEFVRASVLCGDAKDAQLVDARVAAGGTAAGGDGDEAMEAEKERARNPSDPSVIAMLTNVTLSSSTRAPTVCQPESSQGDQRWPQRAHKPRQP